MSFWRFFKKSLVIFIICFVIFMFLLSYFGAPEDKVTVVIGLLISYTNSLAGFALIGWGYKRSNKEFLSAVLGGIIFRFLLIFILLFLLIKIVNINQIALLSSLCSSYILFLILEVWQVHKGVKREEK
jgi:hypothetical protein